jgi:hypothetical protein
MEESRYVNVTAFLGNKIEPVWYNRLESKIRPTNYSGVAMPLNLLWTIAAAVTSGALASLLNAAPQVAAPVIIESEVAIAIERGYEVIRKGVKIYPEHRECFSCHHQALPLVAFSLNGRKSLEANSTEFLKSELTQSMLRFTEESFEPKTDGSWHVATRSKPVQVYFDNGDPHGKDQFISMMATSWSTAALANFQSAGKQPLDSL